MMLRVRHNTLVYSPTRLDRNCFGLTGALIGINERRRNEGSAKNPPKGELIKRAFTSVV
jgi:hypothetical protein